MQAMIHLITNPSLQPRAQHHTPLQATTCKTVNGQQRTLRKGRRGATAAPGGDGGPAPDPDQLGGWTGTICTQDQSRGRIGSPTWNATGAMVRRGNSDAAIFGGNCQSDVR